MITLYKSIKPDFTDDRGDITKLLDDGKTVIMSTLLITCNKGAVRANHLHKKDSHYSYMVSGKMLYSEQPLDQPDKKESVIVEAGDMVYSPPGMIHAMEFLEDSVFLALATESRQQASYEADTVRIKIV